MKKWHIESIRWMNFSLDMVLLYLILLPLYLTEERLLPLFSFLLLIVVGASVTTLLLNQTKKTWTVLSIPLVVSLGLLLNFHILLSVFIGIIVIWRVLGYMEYHNQTNQVAVFFATLIIGVIYYFWLHSFEGIYMALVIIFVQFLLLLTTQTLSSMLQSGMNSGQVNNQMKWLIGGISTLTVLSLGIGFGQPILRQIFLFTWGGFIYLFNLIAMLMLTIFENLNFIDLNKENEMIQVVESGQAEEEINFGEFVEATYAGPMFFTILFLIVLYLIIRSIRNFRKFQIDEFVIDGVEEKGVLTPDNFSPKKLFSPSNDIRKRFYQLELHLRKEGYGRRANETVEDWFTRLPVGNETKSKIKSAYEKVRYGHEEVERQEKTAYKKAMKEMYREIKANK